ncbi:MAG: VTT domain-containing protein [Candidatus Pacebacteria bacterium]|nr:VTT domain-containing protein [Candidatus Paceibacterota bacterium]
MNPKYKKILKLLSIPLILLAVYLILILVWKICNLPSEEALLEMLRDAFAKYGLWIVLIGAILEGLLFIGFYFPGLTIIFFGIVLASANIDIIAKTVAVISIALIVSYLIDYTIGRYGWHKLMVKFGLKSSIDNAKKKIENKKLRTILFSYWNPNFASLIATAAGALKIPFFKFFILNFIGVIVWNIVWAVLAVFLGENAIKYMGIEYVILFIFAWIAILLLKNYFSKKKKI